MGPPAPAGPIAPALAAFEGGTRAARKALELHERLADFLPGEEGGGLRHEVNGVSGREVLEAEERLFAEALASAREARRLAAPLPPCRLGALAARLVVQLEGAFEACRALRADLFGEPGAPLSRAEARERWEGFLALPRPTLLEQRLSIAAAIAPPFAWDPAAAAAQPPPAAAATPGAPRAPRPLLAATAAEAFARGLEKHREGDLRGALVDYGVVLSRDVAHAPAYHWRACARLALRDLAGALADATEAIRLHPPWRAAAHLGRATIRRLAGDLAGAAADYDEALALEPGYEPALAGRARLAAAPPPGASAGDGEERRW